MKLFRVSPKIMKDIKFCRSALIRKRILLLLFVLSSCLMLLSGRQLLKTLPSQSAKLDSNQKVTSEKSMPEVNRTTTPGKHASDDFRFRPRPEANNSVVGKVLGTAKSYRELLDKPLRSAIELTPDNAKDFIFVTATNNKYFHPDMDAIGNVQSLFPNRTIIFYDLEEKKSPADIAKIKKLCGVLYRKFNFTKYPKHIRSLHNYAWKPLIITEVLIEYPVIFWIDSSIRFLTNNFSTVFQQAIQNGGIVTFGVTGHTLFPVVHPGMYRYLPIPRAVAIKVPVREAGHVYVARTRDIYDNIIRWWAACALVEPCIAPTMKRKCQFHGMNVSANCHRFDQSALNILLANHYVYDDRAYSYPTKDITVVHRGSRHKENLAICLSNGKEELKRSSKYFS